MKLAILNDYQGIALDLADWSAVERRFEITVFRKPFASIEAAAEALADFEVIVAMRERQAFPRALLSRLKNLKCLITTGAVNFVIDVDAAREQGIVVCGTNNGDGRLATAELTWALLLDAMRHVSKEDHAVARGAWQTTLGRTLRGKTLGLLGLGHTGSMVARYAQAFGMDVQAWSRNLTRDRATACGVRFCGELDDLLRTSDAVSVHLILSDRTLGLVGARELSLMKPDAVLVNTSRGPIVDEAALAAALEQRKIAAAALDVFTVEPLAADHPFRGLSNITLTPHIGYVTEEVYRLWAQEIIEDIEAFRAGRPIRVLTNDLNRPFL